MKERQHSRRASYLAALLAAAVIAQPLFGREAGGQSSADWSKLALPRTHAPTPTSSAITQEDLRTRLYIFSDDSMGGRLLGSEGNVKGVEYIAAEAKRIGLIPAGDSGSFFQAVPVLNTTVDSSGVITTPSGELKTWLDFIPRHQGSTERSMDGAQVVFGGTWGDRASLVAPSLTAGKVVLLLVNKSGYSGGVPGAVNRDDVSAYYKDAAGIAVAGLDELPAPYERAYHVPVQRFENDHVAIPSFIYVTTAAAEKMLGAPLAGVKPGRAGVVLRGTPRFVSRPLDFPARNVVAMLRGSDARLASEYVAIGAHNDHIGMLDKPVAHDSIYVFDHLFRVEGADSETERLDAAQLKHLNAEIAAARRQSGGVSSRPDSVFNGADDDGSGSMGLLEIAEYLAAQPVKPKRSILFVWHVGEEEGLYGSEFFTDHPTVPRDSIVAQLNMDMIGRGGASDVTGTTKFGLAIHGGNGYLQLVGSRRVSTELGNLAESVNRDDRHGLKFDYSMDADGHPQDIYCRSDHYEYARYGIPIIFFTTGGHADYHEVTDEPQYIDYARYAQVVSYVADLAVHVANLDHRPLVDHPKPDPYGACVQ